MLSDPSVPPLIDATLIEALTATVARASATIVALGAAAQDVRTKADRSPVTAADEASEAAILGDLNRLLPGIPIVSEEAAATSTYGALPSTFILVDPLDGTREFIAGRSEYTVNVALVRDGQPTTGIVAAPALGRIWRGVVGGGAEKLVLEGMKAGAPTPIRPRTVPAAGLIAAVSRSHLDAATEAFLSGLPVVERMMLGSALKFCLVAEGKVDLYARLAPTCEWDIAAGHAVLAAAGGLVAARDGAPVAYGRAHVGFRVPAFLAWGDAEAARRYRG